MPTKWLTVEQAAEQLNASARFVRDKLHTGELPGYKLSPKLWRISQEDLDRFIQSKIAGKDGTSKGGA